MKSLLFGLIVLGYIVLGCGAMTVLVVIYNFVEDWLNEKLK